jgi:hypothetical protein
VVSYFRAIGGLQLTMSDIIGVVHEVNDLSSVTSKATQKPVSIALRRTATLIVPVCQTRHHYRGPI